ncbi:hypothetical protein AAF712_016780 [Marasmius tenuissimus]|uniref:RING-type domain-containing protein n=1 Tax=Marasmius tenuissimus TaxID=585030 RepID=A0ABR2Z5Y1_9AGAR
MLSNQSKLAELLQELQRQERMDLLNIQKDDLEHITTQIKADKDYMTDLEKSLLCYHCHCILEHPVLAPCCGKAYCTLCVVEIRKKELGLFKRVGDGPDGVIFLPDCACGLDRPALVAFDWPEPHPRMKEIANERYTQLLKVIHLRREEELKEADVDEIDASLKVDDDTEMAVEVLVKAEDGDSSSVL